MGYGSVSVRLWFRVWAGRFKDVTLHRKTLRYIVKRYATLQDIALRCKTLHDVVRCYPMLLDVHYLLKYICTVLSGAGF